MLMVNCNTENGGMEIDPRFVIDFGIALSDASRLRAPPNRTRGSALRDGVAPPPLAPAEEIGKNEAEALI